MQEQGSGAQTHARRGSWTEEKKQAARSRELQRRAMLEETADRPPPPSDDLPGFVVIPAWMVPDKSISDLGKWVIVALSLYASRDGKCWPTAATIARTLNRSERTVFRGLQEVVALGLVTVVPRFRRGLQISSVYQLEFSRWGSVKLRPDKNDIPGVSKSSPPGCQNRQAEQNQGTESDQQGDPPNPPTGGEERAPRAATGKKAGEAGKARGPRPRMVQLREELLQRLDAWDPKWGPLSVDVLPKDARARISGEYELLAWRDNDEWMVNQLAQSWRDGDLSVAVEHYAERIRECIDPEKVIPLFRQVSTLVAEERERTRAELREAVIHDYERGALRDARAWRARLARIGA